MPSSKRPFESSCSAATSRTSAALCRSGAASTLGRSRALSVTAAAAASIGSGDGVYIVSGSRIVR